MINQRNKQNRGRKTQKRILETALKLFTEKGYDNVTVEDICEKSGSSKGSFYQHFTSKSSIFLVKFFEVDDYYAQVIETLPKDMDIFEKMSIFFHESMCVINDHMGKDLMKVIYSSAPLSKDHIYFLNKERELTRILLSFANEIQGKQSADHTSHVEDLLMMMNQTMMGAIYYWIVSQDNRSLPDSAQCIINTMIEGLKAGK